MEVNIIKLLVVWYLFAFCLWCDVYLKCRGAVTLFRPLLWIASGVFALAIVDATIANYDDVKLSEMAATIAATVSYVFYFIVLRSPELSTYDVKMYARFQIVAPLATMAGWYLILALVHFSKYITAWIAQ